MLTAFRVVKNACKHFVEDQATQMGAALAYYTLFSLAPLLIIAIAVAGQVYGEKTARDQLVDRIRESFGEESASTVKVMLENFRQLPAEPWAAVAGFVTLWYGAMGVFTQLRSSLNRIWRMPPAQHSFVVWILKDYLLAFVMVLVSSIFVLALLTASTILHAAWDWWSKQVNMGSWAWPTVDFLASAFLITLLFAFTYRFMSDGRVTYKQVLSGAIVSAMLFALGKLGISFYLSHAFLASAYGAAGSLVVFLVWVYYSAQMFFFGAEIIRAQWQG